MSLNIINSITDRSIKDNMSLEGLVGFIKNPSVDHKDKVELARKYGKGSEVYNSIKKTQIPCAILNFTHSKGYVRGNTVSKPTGYLYIDVDGNLDIDLSSEYISAYWKSLSGTGYSIVVAVKGLAKSNYKSATMEVSDLLDLPLDKGAISIDRVTCISYDPNAYYNPNAIVYNIQSKSDNKGISQYATKYNNLSLMGSSLLDTLGQSIRVSTIDDLYKGIDFNGEPIYDLGSKRGMYFDIGFAMGGITEGARNSTMYSVVMQLRAMNTWCQKEQMFHFIKYINRKIFFPMLSWKEVEIIVENAYKVPINKLELKWGKYKRFLYNKDYDLTVKDKRSLLMKSINENKSSTTNKRILSTIEYWNFEKCGKITLKKISEVSRLSEVTVKRRSSNIKEIIKNKNLGYKGKI